MSFLVSPKGGNNVANHADRVVIISRRDIKIKGLLARIFNEGPRIDTLRSISIELTATLEPLP